MNLTTQRKAFTLIELLIVIIIIGILSTLLFRTLADMLTASARIQQEKIMTQELMTIQTTINNISEHYPIIDINKYIPS
jgi:prepilin-type N-terminal cleavage/methylation domain-containing protein